jgi:hypothetical protein
MGIPKEVLDEWKQRGIITTWPSDTGNDDGGNEARRRG